MIAGKAGPYSSGRSRKSLLCLHRKQCSGSLSSQIKHSPGNPGRFNYPQPAYNNQGVAVGLGNGWDSIIYLDGVKRNEETLRWNTAGSRTVTVGSKLYGEAGKITSGALSGSMTMIMHLP